MMAYCCIVLFDSKENAMRNFLRWTKKGILSTRNPRQGRNVLRENNSKKTSRTGFEYRPEQLIHTLMARLQARSLSELARKIGVSPSVLSKVMRRELPISSRILIKIHDSTGLPIRQLRTWMGDDRPFFSRIVV